MNDRIFTAFLERQYVDGMALAAASDILRLVPAAGDPPHRYLAEFRCTGLVTTEQGAIETADRALCGIWFPSDYLHTADPFLVLQWLAPSRPFHPNVAAHAPFICAGRIRAGTPLVDLIFQLYEIITYSRVTMREDDCLNRDACAWARRNQHRFPFDRRSLCRQSADIAVEELA